jgi:sulfatase maturation enzyme AslB (radical SAM superfamily)
MWLHMRLLENCNLKCKHCYARGRAREKVMDFEVFKKSIDLYSEKVKKRKFDNEKRVMLSGGEPFLHNKFKEMLEYTYSKEDVTNISILSNGILVPDFISLLSKYKERIRVQVSIEGGRELDNEIRGKGHFEKALHALKLLMEHQIDFHISYTVSKENMNDYREIIDLSKKYNTKKNNMSPYIGEVDNMLSFNEWEAFKQRVREYAAEVDHTPVASPRCCGWMYMCAAFFGGVTINPDGSLTGCARDNRVVGTYSELDEFYINKGYYMTSTCMRNKWSAADSKKIQQEAQTIY